MQSSANNRTAATVPTDLDRRIWEEELAGFLPEKIFDAHLQARLARLPMTQCLL